MKHPEPGVHAVAREEDHVHPAPAGRELVQGEELSHRGERGTPGEHLRLARRLVAGVRLHPVAGEHPVAFLEIEERPRRDGDGEDGGRRIDPIEEKRQPGGVRTRPPDTARRRGGKAPTRPWTCKGKQVHGRYCRGLVAHGVELVTEETPSRLPSLEAAPIRAPRGPIAPPGRLDPCRENNVLSEIRCAPEPRPAPRSPPAPARLRPGRPVRLQGPAPE